MGPAWRPNAGLGVNVAVTPASAPNFLFHPEEHDFLIGCLSLPNIQVYFRADNVGLLKPEPKVRWLNSPNVYHKVEFEETGTSEPKKLTKVDNKTLIHSGFVSEIDGALYFFQWVPDAATDAAHSNPIKITSPHQFTPVSQNPKEFKEKQKAVSNFDYFSV